MEVSSRSILSRSVTSRIGRAALIVGGGILLSRVLGLVRDMVFASVLGANTFTDEYQVAFIIPDFLNYLLAGGYMAITFIPILSRHLSNDDEEGGWAAFSAILRPLTAGMLIFVAVAMVMARPVIDLIEPGFTAEQVDRAAHLTRIVLPAQVFFVVGTLFMAVQYAKEKFFIPTLAPILYNVGIIAGGLLIQGDEPSPDGFAWGVLGGAIVGNFLIQWYGAHQAGLRIQLGGSWRDPALKEYFVLALPLMLGQSLVLLDEQLGRSFGSLADSDGSISWLQYGRRTMLVPVGVIAQAAGVAAYPYFARLAVEGRVRTLAATMSAAVRRVVVLSVGATAALAALSLPVITILYQRGDWTAADSAATAGTLLFFSLGIPLWGAQQLYARGFYAQRKMWTPVIIGTVATLVALPIYWGLLEAFGVSGLALASTVALAGYTAALGFAWHRSTGWEYFGPIRRAIARAVPIAALAGFGAWGTAELIMRSVDSITVGSVFAVLVGSAVLVAIVVAAVSAIGYIGVIGAPRADYADEPDTSAATAEEELGPES